MGEIKREDITDIVFSDHDDSAIVTVDGKAIKLSSVNVSLLGLTSLDIDEEVDHWRPHEEGYGCWCKPHQIFKGKMLGEMGTVYLHSYAKPSRKDVLEALIKAVYMGEDGHLI